MVCYSSEIMRSLALNGGSGVDTCCHWNDVGPQEEAKPARWFVSNLYVHVDLGIYPALFGWWFTLLIKK